MRHLPYKRLKHRFGAFLLSSLILCWGSLAWTDELPEYQLKAGILYNFTSYTEWPTDVERDLWLCVYDKDPFGHYLDELHKKMVGVHRLLIERTNNLARLKECQIVFISRSAIEKLPRILDVVSGRHVLTVADTPGAVQRGVALNMRKEKSRVVFEANLSALRGSGLNVSSKLLRLATEVVQ